MESTLNLHKSRILGSLPKSRDDFDPLSLLSKLDGGEKIVVCDSNTDLPRNWREISLKEAFGSKRNGDVPNLEEDNASSADEGISSDDGGDALEDEDEDPNEYQEVTMNSTVHVDGPASLPKRVLVFTTVVMLGLLAVCKYGSVDGTFKAMTKKWKQLFVFMVNYQGSFLPVAFSWLPDKTALSYHVFLLLLLQKFKLEHETIVKLYNRGGLKLRKIKLDFESAIHRALEVIFKLRGCFFHFSQAGWRQVQKGGMVIVYMSEKEFRDFVRCVIALPFLPLNQIEAAVDDLRAMALGKDSASYEKICIFQEEFLNYIESTWIRGNFPPKLWNMWKKSTDLTNNQNEGYNSRINKILAVNHPNPWVLVFMLTKELIRAESEALWIKVIFFILGLFPLCGNTFIFSNIPSLCKHKLISDWFPTSRKTCILSPFLNLKNML